MGGVIVADGVSSLMDYIGGNVLRGCVRWPVAFLVTGANLAVVRVVKSTSCRRALRRSSCNASPERFGFHLVTS